MFLRLFVLLLVFANLIFFAWAQGYLGQVDANHEPRRMTQQLQADKLRIVRMDRKAIVERDEIGCRLVSSLKVADAEALKLAIEATGAEVRFLPLAGPLVYRVLIGGLDNEAAMDKKAAELKRLGVKEFNSVTLDGGRQEIILGSFDTEAAAAKFLEGLEKRRVKSAQVERREAPATKAQLEVRVRASVLLQQLPRLIAPYTGASLSICAV
ncbi:MAG: SPOR domain-containing protein [Burkholderiaceae bacterium]|nr:SPOR domain-containing protein [Sulfuritalea sp.]MCF8175288.1 SPOR domain-containing protein [Burkholderiaceae bacterium]